jgi:hypothetical protein
MPTTRLEKLGKNCTGDLEPSFVTNDVPQTPANKELWMPDYRRIQVSNVVFKGDPLPIAVP